LLAGERGVDRPAHTDERFVDRSDEGGHRDRQHLVGLEEHLECDSMLVGDAQQFGNLLGGEAQNAVERLAPNPRLSVDPVVVC